MPILKDKNIQDLLLADTEEEENDDFSTKVRNLYTDKVQLRTLEKKSCCLQKKYIRIIL